MSGANRERIRVCQECGGEAVGPRSAPGNAALVGGLGGAPPKPGYSSNFNPIKANWQPAPCGFMATM